MAEIRFDDGEIVKLPEEITKKLRKELCPDHRQLKVDRFRALKTQTGRGLRLAIMDKSYSVWDGRWPDSNAKAAYYFTETEIREIIKGLSRMIYPLEK